MSNDMPVRNPEDRPGGQVYPEFSEPVVIMPDDFLDEADADLFAAKYAEFAEPPPKERDEH